MEENFNEKDRYIMAKKKVEDIKGFYGNLIAYVIVNIFLIFINLYTSPGYLWFYWPLFWWGLGVVFHGLKVFEVLPGFSKDWEERKIKEFMDKEKEKESLKKWE